MKKNMSRSSIAIMISAVCLLISLLLAGCSKNSDSSQGANRTKESNAEAETAIEQTPLPEVKLTWYYPSSDLLGEEALVYEEINKILKKKINATVDFKPTGWGEYEDKMKVMMASSEEFDMSFTSNWFNNFQLAASKGNFVPLDELLEEYAPKLLASMSDNIWKAARINGKIYAIPNQQIFARGSNMLMPKYFADKYNLDYNAFQREGFKLEDLEPYLESFKNGEPDNYPIKIDWSDLAGYYGIELLGGDGVPGAIYLDDTSLKVFNQFESDQFTQHLTLINSWATKGYFKSKELLSKKDQLDQAKVIGVWFGGTWKPGGEAEASLGWGAEMVERPISNSILNNSGILATLTSISRTSKNPERAMMLLELMNNDEELFNLLTWGIEGKHYTKDGKYIKKMDGSKYVGVPAWLLATTFRSYLLDGQPEDVWEETKKVNEDAQPSPALGFTFDPTPVKTEVANCNAVVKEYVEGLTYNILSMDEDYPVFIAKLKTAGADKVIEEMQRQIDEFKAAN